MGAMAFQITSLTIVYSTVHSSAYNKNQSSASLAFVREIHRWPVNSSHKWPVTRKMFSYDDVTVYDFAIITYLYAIGILLMITLHRCAANIIIKFAPKKLSI